MKILYDHQTFSGIRYGGVARYFYDLIHNLQKIPNVEVELLLKFSNNEYLKDNSVVDFNTYTQFLGNHTNLLFSHLNRLNSGLNIYFRDFDIFHPTFFNNYFLQFLGKKPFVMTYHDVIPEKFHLNYANLDGFDKNYKQKLLDKSSKIIAISENTKQDLLEIFKISEEKIAVVPHSTHFSNFKPSPNFKISLPENYLLYVGNRENYKNFDNFVKDISPLLKKNPDLKLLCAGSSNFSFSEQKLLQNLTISDQVLHRKIDNDDTLFQLYNNAVAFVYPSLYEGFGIPILEAFACGCPVILSNRSSFPEVAENAAIYFNPDDQGSVIYAIESVFENSELRQNFIKKGFERLKDFSPERTARETYEVYKSVIA